MSSVRNYFEKKKDSFTCKVCKQSLSLQASSTTTHLWTHLHRKHPSVYQQAKNDSANKKSSVSVGPTAMEGPPRKKQAIISAFAFKELDSDTRDNYDAAVLKFIVADGRPFETAAGSEFKNLCSVLTDGLYQPPQPTTLSCRLGDMVSNLQQALLNTISSEVAGCRPSITFDNWKADNHFDYMVLTIHYICESSWAMQSRCLSVVNLGKLDPDHSAPETSGIISSELAKYGLGTDQISFATTNVTDSMSSTATLLDIKWHGCASHALQLAINVALETQGAIQSLISSVHSISAFFHSSSIGQEALTRRQIDKGLPESKPPADLTTRFNSTYLLLEWVYRNYDCISSALVDCALKRRCAGNPPQPLPHQSEEILRNVIPVVKPTAEATAILSADRYVSISLIIPCISALKKELAALSAHGIQDFRDELIHQLDERFDLSGDYLLAATFIDPRFKSALFTEDQVNQVRAYIENLRVSQQPESTAEPSVEVKPCFTGSLMDSIFGDVDSVMQEKDVSVFQIEDEIATFLGEPKSHRGEDPIQYWKKKKGQLPVLSSVAQSLLAVQATNRSSESVISIGREVITGPCHNLSHDNAETLIWAHYNKDMLF